MRSKFQVFFQSEKRLKTDHTFSLLKLINTHASGEVRNLGVKKIQMHLINAIYHTNSKEFAEHYGKIFKDAGLDNIIFKITSFK